MTDPDQFTGTPLLHVGDLVDPVDNVPEESIPPPQSQTEVAVAECGERRGDLIQMVDPDFLYGGPFVARLSGAGRSRGRHVASRQWSTDTSNRVGCHKYDDVFRSDNTPRHETTTKRT
jgi:hypothetical protein